MKKWNYYNEEVSDVYTQNAWNQLLISALNEIKGSLLSNDNVILVSYVLKDLMETLLWNKSNKPIIKYRFDNQHSIYYNGTKLIIENYSFNHQKDEEWVESQKNIFLNLNSNPIKEIYPDVWKSKENICNHLNKKFTSGRIIKDDDVIFVGILENKITNIGSAIYFHIDELNSKKPLYEYASDNNENKSLHPHLTPTN